MRLYCEGCQYPQNTCICDHIDKVKTALDIIIVQHEKEAHHAKNTVRLLSLCIPSTQVVCASDNSAMAALEMQCSHKHSALIYPSETSTPLENASATMSNQISTLILVDGSWKQAFGIVKRNPWLGGLPAFHFTNAPDSNYLIRHTSVASALSTLEATAYAINCIENTNVLALHRAQSALQKMWQGPQSHRRKVQ